MKNTYYASIFASIRNNEYLLLHDFLDDGYSANIIDEIGISLLQRSIEANNVDAVCLLLHRGADPNIRNDVLATPLNYINEKTSLVIISNMIKYGADPTLEDNNGNSIFKMLSNSTNFFFNKRIVSYIMNYKEIQFSKKVQDKYSII